MAEQSYKKKSEVESWIGIIVILIMLSIIGFFVYSSYQKVVKTQEDTITSLQKQISEIQNKSTTIK